jgi:hypothetical protein
MIKSNYKLYGAISKEHAKDGRPIFFRNNMEAIFKDGLLIGGKGTQILVEKTVILLKPLKFRLV